MAAIRSDWMHTITLDHQGASGKSSMASQTNMIRYQARVNRVLISLDTPARNSQWAIISQPLANQIPMSKKPLERNSAKAQPALMIAKPALQNNSEASRTLSHSTAR